MKISRHHRLQGGVNPLLAITLGAIAVGSGILIWEWHSAHPTTDKHSKVSSHHHHGKSHHIADAGGKTG